MPCFPDKRAAVLYAEGFIPLLENGWQLTTTITRRKSEGYFVTIVINTSSGGTVKKPRRSFKRRTTILTESIQDG